MSGTTSGGSTIQLVGRGHLDFFLSVNATATLFRFMNVSHTNFAVEPILQQFDNTAMWNGTTANCTIARAADLIHRQYIVVDLPPINAVQLATSTTTYAYEIGRTAASSAGNGDFVAGYRYYTPYDELWAGMAPPIDGFWCHWVDAIGFAMLRKVDLTIGGNLVDSVSAEYLFIWEELTGQTGKRCWDTIGRFETREQRISFARSGGRLYIPLPFWYTQITGNALSMITLAFNAVKLHVTFEALANLVVVSNTDIGVCKSSVGTHNISTGASSNTPLAASDLTAFVMSEFISLDVQERNSFLMGEFDNLMSAVQTATYHISTGTSYDAHLQFNFPVIELLVAFRLTANTLAGRRFAFGRGVPTQDTATGTRDLIAGTRVKLSKPEMPLQTEGTWQYIGMQSRERYVGVLPNTDRDLSAAGELNLWGRTLFQADPIIDMTLRINSTPRFNTMPASYFRQITNKQHHTRIPQQYIYCMPFAMYPEESNSSGSLNFSRLDNQFLRVTLHPDVVGVEMTMFVFARNWNLFSYTRGVGGTKFVS